jgi:hypothetical protein
MQHTRFLVIFAEHFPIDKVEAMAADLNYWAPIRERIADRTYLVRVTREKKLSLFRGRLVYGERAGWWCWENAD